jgi:hypothetical protein
MIMRVPVAEATGRSNKGKRRARDVNARFMRLSP